MNQATRSPSTQASSASKRKRERAWQIDWLWLSLHVRSICTFFCVCVCVRKQKIYSLPLVELRSKGSHGPFVLSFYPLILQLHPYGVSLWQKYGSHDSLSLGLYPSLLKCMCGYVAVRGQSLKYTLISDEYVRALLAVSTGAIFTRLKWVFGCCWWCSGRQVLWYMSPSL